jgi:type III secretory pathway component EscU
LFYLAAHIQFTLDHLNYLNQLICSELITLWLPIAGTVVLGIILCTIVQTGLTWSPAAITPDFKRINLSKGLKKLASSTSLFDAGKTLMKLSFSFIFLFYVFKNQLNSLIA